MRVLLLILIIVAHNQVFGQRFISKQSEVTFFSEAPLENIKATNTKATSLLDTSSGEIVFSVPIREFEFRKSLMKKHFNENYMDSEKFPKSTFKGKISGYRMADGKYQAMAMGEMTIHGVTRKVQIPGTWDAKGERIVLEANFPVSLEDYQIKVPKILFSNIAEQVEVNIHFTFVPHVSK